MGITFSNLVRVATHNKFLVSGKFAFDSSYAAGGEVITPAEIGLSEIESLICAGGEGYQVCYTLSDGKLHVYGASGGGTPTGTNASSAVAGQLNIGTPAFAGTGYATAGQVVTTTDNQTMTENQCAGMWLIGADPTEPPVLIVSNTAVTGAPAVLTCIGVPPVTAAGAYKIVKMTGTAAAQAFTGGAMASGASAEVAGATNLSALDTCLFIAVGY